MFPFYTSLKRQRTFDFVVFAGGIKWKHWSDLFYFYHMIYCLEEKLRKSYLEHVKHL